MSPGRPAAEAGDAAPARRVAVLAGGAGSRLGAGPGTKAAAELGGRPLIYYPLAAARRAGLAPVVVAKHGMSLPELGCPLLTEPTEPRHPLAGVIAALEQLDEPLVVLACDMPLVPAELLAELAGRRARFAMAVEPHPQPLAARYTPGLLPRLRAALTAEERLVAVACSLGGDALGAAELRGYGDPEAMFDNVNTPADLSRVSALLSR